MLDWFPLVAPDFPGRHDAIELLRADHDALKELFDRFEKAGDSRAKRRIAHEAVSKLKIHAALEEEIFYPAVRQRVGKEIMNEADEEHHLAKVLIAELEGMHEHNDHFDAKFGVLAESVRHHIKEEESEILPCARDLNFDFNRLGQAMLRRKRQLLADGIPTSGEEAPVAASGGAGDSAPKPKQNRVHKARKRAKF